MDFGLIEKAAASAIATAMAAWARIARPTPALDADPFATFSEWRS